MDSEMLDALKIAWDNAPFAVLLVLVGMVRALRSSVRALDERETARHENTQRELRRFRRHLSIPPSENGTDRDDETPTVGVR